MTVAAQTLHPGLDPATRRARAAARAAAIADDAPADVVLTGGAITTVDAARSTAEAIAIRYGRIAAVGTAGTVRHLGRPQDPRDRSPRPDASSRASAIRISTR